MPNMFARNPTWNDPSFLQHRDPDAGTAPPGQGSKSPCRPLGAPWLDFPPHPSGAGRFTFISDTRITCMRGARPPHPREIGKSISKGWGLVSGGNGEAGKSSEVYTKTNQKLYQNAAKTSEATPKCNQPHVFSRVWFLMQEGSPKQANPVWRLWFQDAIFDHNEFKGIQNLIEKNKTMP